MFFCSSNLFSSKRHSTSLTLFPRGATASEVAQLHLALETGVVWLVDDVVGSLSTGFEGGLSSLLLPPPLLAFAQEKNMPENVRLEARIRDMNFMRLFLPPPVHTDWFCFS